MFFKVVVV